MTTEPPPFTGSAGKATNRGRANFYKALVLLVLFVGLMAFAAAYSRDRRTCVEYGPGRVVGVMRAPDGGLTFMHDPVCIRREGE